MWIVQWLSNYGQGHQQSQTIEASDREDALAKGERLAKRKHGVLTDVVPAEEDEE